MLSTKLKVWSINWSTYLYTSAIIPAIWTLSSLSVLPLSMASLRLRAYSLSFDFRMLFSRELDITKFWRLIWLSKTIKFSTLIRKKKFQGSTSWAACHTWWPGWRPCPTGHHRWSGLTKGRTPCGQSPMIYCTSVSSNCVALLNTFELWQQTIQEKFKKSVTIYVGRQQSLKHAVCRNIDFSSGKSWWHD